MSNAAVLLSPGEDATVAWKKLRKARTRARKAERKRVSFLARYEDG